jgi:mono/diheme cytochrome c family protein
MRNAVRLSLSALALTGLALGAVRVGADERTSQTPQQHDHGGPTGSHDHHGSGQHAHEHPTPPPEYAKLHAPAGTWTDARTIARGKEIYDARCAVCHGARGDGKGPGAASLQVKPADFTDRTMVAEMTDSYWFWRVSEGGVVEPFKSEGSAMPAWKGVLSEKDRWAVIAYQHTLSGHRGAHVPGQHPEMAHGEHGHEDGHAHGTGQSEHTHEPSASASAGAEDPHHQH